MSEKITITLNKRQAGFIAALIGMGASMDEEVFGPFWELSDFAPAEWEAAACATLSFPAIAVDAVDAMWEAAKAASQKGQEVA